MKRTTIVLAATLALLLLSGCATVTGVEIETSILDDGSGQFVLAFGVLEDEDGDGEIDNEIGCGEMDASSPPGASVVKEYRGEEAWCIDTIPFESLSAYRSFLSEFQLFEFNCLAIIDDVLYVDMAYDPAPMLESAEPGALEEGGDAPFTFTIVTPSDVNTHNADTYDFNRLTWNLALPQRTDMRVNLEEGEACPSGLSMDLDVFVREEDNSGQAEIRMGVPAEVETEELITDYLTANGWTITTTSGTGQIAAEQEVSGDGGYTDMLLSAPGFEASESFIRLTIEEDDVTGLKLWDMITRLDMDAYVANWAAILEEGAAPPAFRYTAYLPGDVENTFETEWSEPSGLIYTWSPGEPTGIRSLHAQSANEVRQTNLDEIIARYMAAIPDGQVRTNPTAVQEKLLLVFPPGSVNNMTNGHNQYSCGGYQDKVLGFLTEMRNSTDPETRHLLSALDYGPIQSYWGGHQGVVLFPTGTDWFNSGIVLDPWNDQTPRVYTMEEWKDRFGFGAFGTQSGGAGIGPGAAPQQTSLTNYYPHLTGGAPRYPSDVPSRPFPELSSVTINSPVDVLVVSADGRRLGLTPEGEYVNEIEGAFIYRFPKDDGTTQWLVQVPEGEYVTQINGTGSGAYHVMAGDPSGTLVAYGAQPIAAGQQATLPVAAGLAAQTLTGVDGEAIAAVAVTNDNAEALLAGGVTAAPASDAAAAAFAARPGEDSAASDGLIAGMSIALLFIVCGVALAGVLLVFVVFMRRRSA